jgi:hypothetical protein
MRYGRPNRPDGVNEASCEQVRLSVFMFPNQGGGGGGGGGWKRGFWNGRVGVPLLCCSILCKTRWSGQASCETTGYRGGHLDQTTMPAGARPGWGGVAQQLNSVLSTGLPPPCVVLKAQLSAYTRRGNIVGTADAGRMDRRRWRREGALCYITSLVCGKKELP